VKRAQIVAKLAQFQTLQILPAPESNLPGNNFRHECHQLTLESGFGFHTAQAKPIYSTFKCSILGLIILDQKNAQWTKVDRFYKEADIKAQTFEASNIVLGSRLV
jgi:hypothetical protein